MTSKLSCQVRVQKCHIFASRLNSTTRACLLYGRLILLLPSCHCTASESLRTLHLTTSCGAVSDVPGDTVAKALTISLSAFITDSRYYLLSASCRQASAARRGALQCCLKHFTLGHHMRMPSTAQRRVFGAAVLVITLVLLALLMAQRYISPAAMHRSNATHNTSHVVPEELSMHAFCNITGDKRRVRQGLLETLLGTIALLRACSAHAKARTLVRSGGCDSCGVSSAVTYADHQREGCAETGYRQALNCTYHSVKAYEVTCHAAHKHPSLSILWDCFPVAGPNIETRVDEHDIHICVRR